MEIWPLYREEMDYKLKHGADDLLTRFQKANLKPPQVEVLDLGRRNACRKRFWLF